MVTVTALFTVVNYFYQSNGNKYRYFVFFMPERCGNDVERNRQ